MRRRDFLASCSPMSDDHAASTVGEGAILANGRRGGDETIRSSCSETTR